MTRSLMFWTSTETATFPWTSSRFHIIGPDISEAEMTLAFNTIDTSKNGEISREEFIAAAFDFIHGLEETEISKVFFGHLS